MPVVPTHPVTTPDPDVLRWVVPDGLLPFTGEVAQAPAMLQSLIDDGTLGSVRVDGGGVRAHARGSGGGRLGRPARLGLWPSRARGVGGGLNVPPTRKILEKK